MGNPQDMETRLAERANSGVQAADPAKTIASLLKKMEPEIARALPKHLTPDRLSRICLTSIRQNQKLLNCDQMSLLAAVMQSAQLGLEPNTPLGEAYIIPYGKEAQFQIGYKGIISLAHRTGEYQSIYAHEVYKNDKFEYSYGLDKKLIHVPADEPEGDPIYYYAVYKLKNGGMDFVVWSAKKIETHAKKYSQAFQKGWTTPWKTDFPAMAKKTVLKEVLKYAPKSAELAKALSADETIKHEIAEDMSVVPSVVIDIDATSSEAEEQKADTADEKQEAKS